jgi:hypothetical protein
MARARDHDVYVYVFVIESLFTTHIVGRAG